MVNQLLRIRLSLSSIILSQGEISLPFSLILNILRIRILNLHTYHGGKHVLKMKD